MFNGRRAVDDYLRTSCRLISCPSAVTTARQAPTTSVGLLGVGGGASGTLCRTELTPDDFTSEVGETTFDPEPRLEPVASFEVVAELDEFRTSP
jgi:hypothetical protein